MSNKIVPCPAYSKECPRECPLHDTNEHDISIVTAEFNRQAKLTGRDTITEEDFIRQRLNLPPEKQAIYHTKMIASMGDNALLCALYVKTLPQA